MSYLFHNQILVDDSSAVYLNEQTGVRQSIFQTG